MKKIVLSQLPLLALAVMFGAASYKKVQAKSASLSSDRFSWLFAGNGAQSSRPWRRCSIYNGLSANGFWKVTLDEAIDLATMV